MHCRLIYTWHTSNRVSRNLIQLTRRLFRGLDHSLAVDDVSVYIYTHMKTTGDTGLINSLTHSRYRFPGLFCVLPLVLLAMAAASLDSSLLLGNLGQKLRGNRAPKASRLPFLSSSHCPSEAIRCPLGLSHSPPLKSRLGPHPRIIPFAASPEESVSLIAIL